MRKEYLRKRADIIRGIREYFWGRGFMEVETPLLLPTVSTEPNLEVFETELRDDRGSKRRMFLPTSPEYAMKKLLSRGSGSIFQITKSFRNEEGKSPRHSPEFTILEWYEVGGDYMSVVREFEMLVHSLVGKFRQSENSESRKVRMPESQIGYQGKIYDIGAPWERVSVREAFEGVGIGEEEMLDSEQLLACGKRKGYQIRETTTWEEVWNQIMANEIEPKLGQKRPTVLYDYPVAQAALSKKCQDPRYAERAEVFLAGMELANIFSELTDYREQEARCRAELLERKRLGRTEYPLDREFIKALRAGVPECGGVAVGVDRLVMLLTDSAEIGEVRVI